MTRIHLRVTGEWVRLASAEVVDIDVHSPGAALSRQSL